MLRMMADQCSRVRELRGTIHSESPLLDQNKEKSNTQCDHLIKSARKVLSIILQNRHTIKTITVEY